MAESFKKQIEADIKEYQQNLSHIKNMAKDEWAFNYWVLDKLFFEEEELIEEKIIDYHDMGVDAYEIYEDTKDIYLIQNKYFSENTKLPADYVKNDFLLRPITALANGTYKKSEELQKAFNKFKNCDDFTVYLQIFITNNCKSKEIESYLKKFNTEHPKYRAQVFYLEDIEAKYYNEVQQIKKNLSIKIETINRGTILNINNSDYHLQNVIDARYVFTPVVSIYRLYREAIEHNYPIFDKNIREYLGNKGVNKNIYQTLLDSDERKNFFYYNNGITMICDKMHTTATQSGNSKLNACFTVDNPQIVNGCQTVNSIYEAMNNIEASCLEKEFQDCFVMMKILEIDRGNQEQNDLYTNIVKFNNSQNAIDEKTFVANSALFNRLQDEFEKKGFILLIKQSDKNKFSKKYKIISELNKLNSSRIKRFGLNEPQKVNDVFVPLEKLLQVINAFVAGGQIAYTKKSCMLKYDSEQYKTATDFIKNPEITNDSILDLYLLYTRAEQEKKQKSDSRAPISYYLIDLFALYECDKRKLANIPLNLDEQEKINHLIKLYTGVTKAYAKDYLKKYNVDYNKMIKQAVDYEILDKERDTLSDIL